MARVQTGRTQGYTYVTQNGYVICIYIFPGSFLSLPGREVGKGFPIGISRWIVQIVPDTHIHTFFFFLAKAYGTKTHRRMEIGRRNRHKK